MFMATIFSSKNLIKILLVILSLFFWIYFLISSKLTLEKIIAFDLIYIFNSVFTWNFLLFLLFFPLPSIIFLAIGINNKTKESFKLLAIISVILLVLTFVIFNPNIYFILFLILYFIAHGVVIYLIRKKSKTDYKNLYELTTSQLSKLSIFLVLAFFFAGFLYIFPTQKQSAYEMEQGLVSAFVADDLGPWIDTSYTISAKCTQSNLEHIMSSNQYKALERKTDKESIMFTEYLEDLYIKSKQDKTPAEIKEMYPNLNAPEIKSKVIATIKSIPFMTIVENYFAFFFMFFVSSFVYTYLTIVFLFYALFIYLFNRIFVEEKEEI